MFPNPILAGNAEIGYRDPACVYVDGRYRLFFTISHKREGYLYNTLGLSESSDLVHWTEPRQLTAENRLENYCSPGNVLRVGEEWLLCVSSYPMPKPYAEYPYADETARLYLLRTRDFVHFSAPELIRAKGDAVPTEAMGRMIDPYLFRDHSDSGLYHLFFKQNGVSHAYSRDLLHWTCDGAMAGGENACVLWHNGLYHLFHSPANGIGHKVSADLHHWTDKGIFTLRQSAWDWASGRLTAGFVMEALPTAPHRYLLFFHGSRADATPETHGNASIALAFSDDLETFQA